MHGGVKKTELGTENLDALDKGFANLKKQVENMRKFGLPVLVGINRFVNDTQAEIDLLTKKCEEFGVEVSLNDCWAKGGEGGIEMAEKLVKILEKGEANYKPLYDEKSSIEEKLNTIVKEIYGADGVNIEPAAMKQIKTLESFGLDKLPICMAKTQFSFTDDPNVMGAPTGFKITIQDVRVSAGAGFIVCQTSNIMVMPGLPKVPAAEKMDIDKDGVIAGLF